jgi:hypothetical protein
MLAFLFLLVAVIALLVLIPSLRERVVEALKELSDLAILKFLRATSRFGTELTDDGRAEQLRWQEQRLRNLRGLSLRAKGRFRGRDQQSDPSATPKPDDKGRSDFSF